MSDWYCSSSAYALIPAFQASHTYSVGDIIVPTAPALRAKWVLRCTTAGTSGTEPAWPTTNNATVTSTGATFTNVTGQSTYFWAAAAGDMQTLLGAVGNNRFAGGDRLFVSSDHSETQTASSNCNWGSGANAAASYNGSQILSVNRAGSTPPVAADLLAGATITQAGTNAQLIVEAAFPTYHYGITYIYTGTITSTGIVFGNTSLKTTIFDSCQLYLNVTTANLKISSSNPATVILKNTTLRFGATTQSFTNVYPLDFTWIGTLSAIAGAILPATLFTVSAAQSLSLITCRGVDLSAITGTLVLNGSYGGKVLFDSCKIASGVTRYSTTSVTNTRDVVELVNCYDGTNIVNERYTPAGTLTTERTITLFGGATDDVGTFSHKLVSTANVDKYANFFESFWMDVEYTTTGASKTATVEIISSTALNNDEISLQLEYQGTAGSSLAAFADSLPATQLTTAAAVATSTATWNSSPATPQKQHLQVTFTPQVAGRVRGIVRLGKASATCYINPQIAIT